MKNYLFIQSQDVFYEARTSAQYQLAISLAKAQGKVSILLVQNAVLATRKGVNSAVYADLHKHHVNVYADELSLNQREIATDNINEFVKPAPISMVIDAMLNGDKVVWW